MWSSWFSASTCSVCHSESLGKPAGFLDSRSQYTVVYTHYYYYGSISQVWSRQEQNFFVWKRRVCCVLVRDFAPRFQLAGPRFVPTMHRCPFLLSKRIIIMQCYKVTLSSILNSNYKKLLVNNYQTFSTPFATLSRTTDN